MTPRRLFVFSLVIATMAGCAAAPSTGSLGPVVDQYEAGWYDRSYDDAMEIVRGGPGPDRAAAAYLAGLSAYRLDRREEAELRLRVASESGERDVSARARAMLGVIRLEQGRTGEAGRLLRDATPELEGDDARQSTRLADDASRHGPSWSASTSTPRLQSRAVSNMTAAAPAAPAASFALQAGAFREPDRARSVAMELSGVARRRGLDPVQVITSTGPRGRSLYLVHVGEFESRQEAARVRGELGRPHFIVTPIRLNATDTVMRMP